MWKIFHLDGESCSILLDNNIYDDFVTHLNNLILVCKLTDGVVNFNSSKERINVFFHKEKISFLLTLTKNIDKNLNKVSVIFSKDEKENLLKLFHDDMDIDISDFGKDVKVYTNIKGAFVKLLKKLQCV
jgi:hypothetical protein